MVRHVLNAIVDAMEHWTIREQLILGSAVQRSGDQNWSVNILHARWQRYSLLPAGYLLVEQSDHYQRRTGKRIFTLKR